MKLETSLLQPMLTMNSRFLFLISYIGINHTENSMHSMAHINSTRKLIQSISALRITS